MKSYPIKFGRFPYYEHLQIAHLFDTMHIGNNATETLSVTTGAKEGER